MLYIMDAAVEENVGTVTTYSDLNPSAIKVNGEVNGSYSEPMDVDEQDEVIAVKKMASDINCVDDVDKNEVEEAGETDEVGAAPICEVPDIDGNVSSNGFGENCNNESKGHVSADDSQDEMNFEEVEKIDDDDDDCQIASSDPLENNESSLDFNDSNLESNCDASQSNSIVLDTTDASDCTAVEPIDPLAIHNGLEDTAESKVSEDKNKGNPKGTKSETEDVGSTVEDKSTNEIQITDEKPEDLTGEKTKPEDDSVDSTPDKGKKPKKVQQPINITPRRSSRNLNKQKSYIEKEDELKDLDIIKTSKKPNDDPDIEEITPVDPLAADPVPDYFRDKENNKLRMSKKTIVVNDTKRLVEIASGGKQSKMNKKEPTLVIIDTNSILSGRGPIPISSSSAIPGTSRNQGYSVLPVALPAQGMYPQMRTHSQVKPMTIQSSQSSSLQIQPQAAKPPIILPSLTDDMYVVEAPSFIVPYVYEKPPIKPLKDYVDQIEQAIKEIKELLEKEKLEQEKKDAEARTDEQNLDNVEEVKIKETSIEDDKKEEKEKVEDDSKMEVDENKDNENKKDDVEAKELNDSEAKMDVDEEKEKDEDGTSEKGNKSDAKNEKDNIDKSNEPEESTDKPNEDVETVKVVESKASDTKITDEKGKEESESNKFVSSENNKIVSGIEEKSDLEKSKKQSHSYFDNPLGKFFIQIGVNLVQEHVQTDLLRSQKRKKDRDGNNCAPEVQMAITSLIRTLEFSKENNEPFRLEQKKCEFCSFKTESMLVMAHHLETPHMRNYVYRCNFCPLEVRSPHDILFHMEAEHNVRGRLERAPAFHQCPSCPFEDNQKGKLTRHLLSCAKKYRPERNQEPPLDFEPPAKIPRISRNRPSMSPGNAVYQAAMSGLKQGGASHPLLPKLVPTAAPSIGQNLLNRGRGRPQMMNRYLGGDMRSTSPLAAQQKAMAAAAQARQGMLYRPSGSNAQPQVLIPTSYQLAGNQIYQNSGSSQKSSGNSNASGGAGAAAKLLQQPSISITPLPRQQATPTPAPTPTHGKPGRPLGSGKATFVICEICDGYIKDLEQLRNHMQWIHKVKIHPKMIYNRPPLNCQKCQFRFFTDQGLERHLLGSHGLVTSSMQEAANRGKDGGRCPVCGRVYQWKLLNHVARDHNMSLKPAHLSYKCTVCTATFGMYKQFENHVYSAHSVVAKRVMDKKPTTSSSQPSTSSSSHQGDSLLKPLKINDEITIIPQPVRSSKPVSKPGPSSRSGPQSSKGKV